MQNTTDINKLVSDLHLAYSDEQLALITQKEYRQDVIATTYIASEEIGVDADAIAAWLLQDADIQTITTLFGKNVATIVRGLHRVEQLYQNKPHLKQRISANYS